MGGGQIQVQILEVSLAKNPSPMLKESVPVETAFICKKKKKDFFTVTHTKMAVESMDNLFDL